MPPGAHYVAALYLYGPTDDVEEAYVLQRNINLLEGQVEVTVPSVAQGYDYQVGREYYCL